mgnify:FL=1
MLPNIKLNLDFKKVLVPLYDLAIPLWDPLDPVGLYQLMGKTWNQSGKSLACHRAKLPGTQCVICTIFNSLTYSFSSATKIEKLSNCQSKVGLVMVTIKIIMGKWTLNYREIFNKILFTCLIFMEIPNPKKDI